MSDERTKEQPKRKYTIMDILGGILLFACFLSLIVGVVVYFAKEPVIPEKREVHLTIHADSLGVVLPEETITLDTLATYVNQLNSEVHERYVYFIEQKENEIKLITFGGVLVSIILAILGFFGYKSFKSIEDKAVQNAEDSVSSRLTQIKNKLNKELAAKIDNRFDNEYESNLKNTVAALLKDQYDEEINQRLGAIDSKVGVITDLQNKQTRFEIIVSKLHDKGVLDDDEIVGEGSDLDDFYKERQSKIGIAGKTGNQQSSGGAPENKEEENPPEKDSDGKSKGEPSPDKKPDIKEKKKGGKK